MYDLRQNRDFTKHCVQSTASLKGAGGGRGREAPGVVAAPEPPPHRGRGGDPRQARGRVPGHHRARVRGRGQRGPEEAVHAGQQGPGQSGHTPHLIFLFVL